MNILSVTQIIHFQECKEVQPTNLCYNPPEESQEAYHEDYCDDFGYYLKWAVKLKPASRDPSPGEPGINCLVVITVVQLNNQ